MTGYEPLDALKSIAPELWIVDGPPTIYRKVPIPTRATIVRLTSGDLWVHAPTRPTDDLKAELADLGPVRHIVAPRVVPSEYLTHWTGTYPAAQLWRVSSGADPAESFRPLGDKSDRQWQGEIDQFLIEGKYGFCEPVFYHPASRSLIVADFIHNIETAKLPTRFRPFVWIAGTDYPIGRMPPGVLKHYHRHEDQLVQGIEEMLDLQLDRIVVSHGTSFIENCGATMKYAFRKQFRDRNMGRLIAVKNKR